MNHHGFQYWIILPLFSQQVSYHTEKTIQLEAVLKGLNFFHHIMVGLVVFQIWNGSRNIPLGKMLFQIMIDFTQNGETYKG